MASDRLTRRDFQRLSAAALGGLIAGAGVTGGLTGCDQGGSPTAGDDHDHDHDHAGHDHGDATADAGAGPSAEYLLQEPHVCRGLNTCKGKGQGGDNACAGQGTCATVEAHACGGQNACKGQGGCGANPGMNACSGKGGCHVPLTHGTAWERTRKNFEEAMEAAGKTFGEAPPKPAS